MTESDVARETAGPGDVPPGWRSAIRGVLRNLSVQDMPGLEILFLDELTAWAFSIGNPGRDYDERHGSVVVAGLFRAMEHSRAFRPARPPAESGQIAAARQRVVAGAHEFAAAPDGLAHLIAALAAAVARELENNAGRPAAQAYWLYHYCLVILSGGMTGRTESGTLEGITAVYRAWEQQAEQGYRLPWQTWHGLESQASADMVVSHVEKLIRRLTGADKVSTDADGDYPIRYRSALYFVRVVRALRPVVQIFSVAVDKIGYSDDLARELNDINSRVHFCRAFWVHDQVLIEAEHLGPSLTEADFDECALTVAEATDTFAGRLAERFGGRLAFEETKSEQQRAAPADDRRGYL